MDLSGRNILVTGGGAGIGLALARALHAKGNRVIICGRDEARLGEVVRETPGLIPVRADVATAAGRDALLADALARLPDLDMLVNNAGIQRRAKFHADAADWTERAQEIAINFEAPVHLAALFLPHFLACPGAAIVNVSSGLAFLPVTFAPVYAATKAALHSFTIALRDDLRGTRVKVAEIIPPMVNTGLGGQGLHVAGVPVDIFVKAVVDRLAAGELEIGYDMSEKFRTASREELAGILAQLNG
ncbi:SDR family oxidoreductase [Sphingobium sp. EM0848]|uniref:SDR family oxidoreductase n=1 Tax=Sphingobium sp. EM0848 TaxID=2743473 RepID=UPI00159C47A4|nr:SDR family NAD(P)-dependent oxidoreductase [Sphingobium sp. EM0848]